MNLGFVVRENVFSVAAWWWIERERERERERGREGGEGTKDELVGKDARARVRY